MPYAKGKYRCKKGCGRVVSEPGRQCKVCAAEAWGKAGRRTWEFSQQHAADKAKRHPTESWWVNKPRGTAWEQAQAKEQARLQAGGISE